MTEYFTNVPKIKYEGKDSKNPLSFKYYNPEEVVGDKPMREHLRFTMSYWHTLTGEGKTHLALAPWKGHGMEKRIQ